jgi:hypothetical protein
MDSQEWAQSLRRRINDHALDTELLAAEALALFEAAGSPIHKRWLWLELHGFGTAVDHAPLHDVLSVPAGDRLAVHVSAYRSQQGRILEPPPFTGHPFRHFFVESIHELSEAALRFRSTGASEVRLDFGPGIPDYPAAGTFPANVFDRILLGVRAVLHLQLASIAA